MKKVDSIVILGGGTSAWFSAAYLSHNIPNLKITVIDKEIGTPVGVGEGTLLNFGPFMQSCGFDMDDWFPKIDATYKSGILFPNWKNIGNVVWHPFKMNVDVHPEFSLFDLWSNNQHMEFKKYGLPMHSLSIDQNSIDLNEKYGYHVDCSKLVMYIKEKLAGRLNFIQSEMVNDCRDENNNIVSLQLKNGQEVSADLFIDCTGFRSLLNKNPKKINLLGTRLFCDTAIAGHIPYIDRKKELRPYVISDAVEHGWIWNIPVKTRIGSGLVFNRSITDPEDAKDFFVKYWDNRISKDSLKIIDWTPHYKENFWHNNVVSIGLSAGFIEPLESTGIALITEGIYQLAHRIIDKHYNGNDINLYNQTMKCFFEESIDFVSMHYSATERTEPFWQYVKANAVQSEKQKFLINELSRTDTRVPSKGKNTNFFCGENWSLWLIQLGFACGERNLNLSKEQSEFILKTFYNRNEKYRHVWSRNHYEEIERLENFYAI